MTTALELFPAAPQPRPARHPDQPPAAQRSPEGVSAAGAEMPIGIYRVTLGISTWVWLCVRHVTARRQAGWACDRTGGAEWLTCDDCVREAQS